MNKKRNFHRFETIELYHEWANSQYHKPHFVLIIFPSQAIYACLRQLVKKEPKDA